jgi:hypothetical protein
MKNKLIVKLISVILKKYFIEHKKNQIKILKY